MSAALADCYQLLQISEYLGCTHINSKAIEVALLKHGQNLFRAIQGAPYVWINLAYGIRSEVIFQECMIHLVGNWKFFKTKREALSHIREVPKLHGLIEKYHRRLLAQCKHIELALVSVYPGKIRLPTDDIPIKREYYAKDMLVWMALTFYRHWVSQQLIFEHGRHGPDSGFALISKIGAAGDAYIDKAVITHFHTRFPLTKKAMNVLENHVYEIKSWMRNIVREHGMLKSKCQLDVRQHPVKYFTCMEFQPKDFPWVGDKEKEKVTVVPAKRQYQPGGNDIAWANLNSARLLQERSASFEEMRELEDEDEDEAEDRDMVVLEELYDGEAEDDEVDFGMGPPGGKRQRIG